MVLVTVQRARWAEIKRRGEQGAGAKGCGEPCECEVRARGVTSRAPF